MKTYIQKIDAMIKKLWLIAITLFIIFWIVREMLGIKDAFS